jgi:hypothetical protein
VGGVQHSCYALYEGRLLAGAILSGRPPGWSCSGRPSSPPS